jgi:hypothetical protein
VYEIPTLMSVEADSFPEADLELSCVLGCDCSLLIAVVVGLTPA